MPDGLLGYFPGQNQFLTLHLAVLQSDSRQLGIEIGYGLLVSGNGQLALGFGFNESHVVMIQSGQSVLHPPHLFCKSLSLFHFNLRLASLG